MSDWSSVVCSSDFNDTLEDYALRFTAQKARRWSAWWVANCALGSIAFLACEAIGATVTLSYGFDNTAIALLIAGVIFLIAGLPICYYGARYGVDMDLDRKSTRLNSSH